MPKIHKQGATQMLFRVAGANMKPCYKKNGVEGSDNEEYRYIEVTQELCKMGVTCIADGRKLADENGMVNPVYLNIGDFILVKKNGVYRMNRENFLEKYFI